ncbi:MAG: RdgB/HAM1 family non-canonical purine NTP pyrophosphatase [Clostridia bacterium]|nr:RdgB/HAM1 family non-canonical purine NTP pyrophosphatase [Clostridia bacterium]
MKFFLATKNEGKIREFKRIFNSLGIEMLSQKDFESIMPEPDENGKTFTDNALIKAHAGMEFSGLPTVSDDSGLCVDALDGRPGILSARYSGIHGNDKENNKKLLSELKSVPESSRTARYVCAVACVFPDGREFTVSGECEGIIDFHESGSGGFGYDPLFISSIGKFSEISAEEKDKVSHRGIAISKFEEKLKDYL